MGEGGADVWRVRVRRLGSVQCPQSQLKGGDVESEGEYQETHVAETEMWWGAWRRNGWMTGENDNRKSP